MKGCYGLLKPAVRRYIINTFTLLASNVQVAQCDRGLFFTGNSNPGGVIWLFFSFSFLFCLFDCLFVFFIFVCLFCFVLLCFFFFGGGRVKKPFIER